MLHYDSLSVAEMGEIRDSTDCVLIVRVIHINLLSKLTFIVQCSGFPESVPFQGT